MHILFTDSGVGGLSVCAYAEAFLRSNGVAVPTRLTYVNASAENEFGYNALASRQEKLRHFDRFLHIVTTRYKPDLIYIACNTLSVLLAETSFFTNKQIPIRGIVETGVDRIVADVANSPKRDVMIFGTVTTIEAQTYPAKLVERGVSPEHIISQACPTVADTISEDRQGLQAAREIEECVLAALEQPERKVESCLAYLACTHYGYRKQLFKAAFEKVGAQAEVLNPNEFAAHDLLGNCVGDLTQDAVDVEFVTRYRPPETALETISFFLRDISPKTIHAFQNYTHAPDLFPGFRPEIQESGN